MDDLIAFLNARLDEDEAAARAAGGRSWRQPDPERTPGWVEDDSGRIDRIVVYDEGAPTAGQAAHIARHDPARVLREVEADRKLIAAYVAAKADVPPVDDWYEVADGIKIGVSDGLESALKIRIARFDGHPGYRPEWKP